MRGLLPWGTWGETLTLGSTLPFLHFSVCLQDQNPVKKRKKIPKKGQKKKGQWMVGLRWSSAGWGEWTRMPALWICHSGPYQFQWLSLPYWALISLDGLLFFFFLKLKISIIYKRGSGFHLSGPTTHLGFLKYSYRRIAWRNCCPISLSFLRLVFCPGRTERVLTRGPAPIEPFCVDILFFLSLQLFQLSFASFLVSLPFRFSEAAVIMGVHIYIYFCHPGMLLISLYVGFFLGIH